MLYIDDAIRATLELMEAPTQQIHIRSSYNLAGMSFTPGKLAQEIQKHIPDFSITYEPDFRQSIADSWTESIDDRYASLDWGWKPEYDLAGMTAEMINQLRKKFSG
jgi:nucleoside-diphosphate-sugar epimerase